LFSIANELTKLGHSCAICVPDSPRSVFDHGMPQFQVLDYEACERNGVTFANGKPPTLIHAWTPRELVRKMTKSLVARYKAPYFVHLEDNEAAILLDEMQGVTLADLRRLPMRLLDSMIPNHRSHPLRSEQLLTGASGVTALIDRLLEFKPENIPGLVFFPGFDMEYAQIGGRDEITRKEFGISPDEILVVYTGNIHNSNFKEVRSLLLAIVIANRRGLKVKLIKTGSNHYLLPEISDSEVRPHLIDLGFVPRAQVPILIAAADVLVQPGHSNDFNDYRFPSKLPEFLVSGRPVILPRSNVGLLLEHRRQAVILDDGHSLEIADALEQLALDPALRAEVGRNGRNFALENLSWIKNAPLLPTFYQRCLAEPPAPVRFDKSGDRLVPKLIAFYLPQFHPIPENDAWWGRGFTEWTNVVSARPNFVGHLQPRLPADLGFYDLRLPESIDAQIELASRYGVYGFCFHYYWFNGRHLLERPLMQFLGRPQADFPFCISWANENWTRRWDGLEHEILLKQDYGSDFATRFIRDVIPILRDPRYIRIDGAPLLMVYRVTDLPDPRATAEVWRDECRKAGLPAVHLAAVQSFGITDPRPFGFDAAVEFPPHTNRFLVDSKTYPDISPDFEGHLEDYPSVVADQLKKPVPDYILYRGVMPSWDNTPRRKRRAHILVNGSPEAYQSWLRGVVAQTLALVPSQEPMIFVNAWNEWAEGAVLEPDIMSGHRFLEATKSGLGLGTADFLRSLGIDVDILPATELAIESDLEPMSPARARPPHITEQWFNDEELIAMAERYRRDFEVGPLSYATVRDFCDSVDHIGPIATLNGDLKDSQRPWMLKALFSVVPQGGRILEIGAGEPFVADLLDRLGYEVWIVDPYDGTGNGPLEYERFRRDYPNLRFVRGLFGEQILSAPPAGFDCIYSISVLEHVPTNLLGNVFRGMKKYLKPNGWSIHAIDHVHKGNQADSHLATLTSMVEWSGIQQTELTTLLAQMNEDVETYYLSAESHNRWRGVLPYDHFPMRVCVSIQLVSPTASLHPPEVPPE
jgi:glycosyltransferase involved in cell wall biosynthesis